MRRRIPPEQVVLHLEGVEAVRGLALDFETFLDEIRRALRAFDRVRRLEDPRKTGHPERRSELVTAFRLLEFKPVGSNIVTIEPIVEEPEETVISLAAPSLPFENLRMLMEAVDAGAELDPDVTDALESARTALGRDGRIEVRLPDARLNGRKIVIDETKIASLRKPRALELAPARVSASGRLYAIDLERHRVGIRASTGVEWLCRYPEELDALVKRLLDTRVWATGRGALSGRKGTMQIEEVTSLQEYEQTPLFTVEQVPVRDLLEQQGIRRPQGLASLRELRWEDDEASERFLEAILGSD